MSGHFAQSVAKTAATDKSADPAAHPAAFAFSGPDFLTAARVARDQESLVGPSQNWRSAGSVAFGSSDLPRSLSRRRARVRNKRRAPRQDIGSGATISWALGGANKGSSRGSIRLARSQRQAPRAAQPALNRERTVLSQPILSFSVSTQAHSVEKRRF
jgi:hypothetical protein